MADHLDLQCGSYGLIVRSPAISILLALVFVGGLIQLNHVLDAAFDSSVIEHPSDIKSFKFLDGARVYLHHMSRALRKVFHMSQSVRT